MSAQNVDEKAESLHSLVLSKLDKFCPEKIRKIASDDQPFITDQLKRLDRKRRREYRKNLDMTNLDDLVSYFNSILK